MEEQRNVYEKKRGSPWPAELAGAIVPPRDAAEGGRRQSARAAMSPAPPSHPHARSSERPDPAAAGARSTKARTAPAAT